MERKKLKINEFEESNIDKAKKTHKKRRIIIAVLLVAAVIGGSVAIVAYREKHQPQEYIKAELTETESIMLSAADEKATKESTEKSTMESTEKKEEITTPKVSLEEFYRRNYNSSNSGMAREDFNGDGKEEMIVLENRTYSNGRIKNFTLTYIALVKNKPVIKDSMTVNDTRMFPSDEFDYSSYSGTFTKLEAYANEKGYMNVNYYLHFQGSSVNYMIFYIKNEKIAEENHIYDPGYTSGNGLYEFDGYFYDYEKSEIYNDEPEIYSGDKIGYNYKNYGEAINGQLNKYGFSYIGQDEMDDDFWMNKYHINEKSDKTKTIYKYSKSW